MDAVEIDRGQGIQRISTDLKTRRIKKLLIVGIMKKLDTIRFSVEHQEKFQRTRPKQTLLQNSYMMCS